MQPRAPMRHAPAAINVGPDFAPHLGLGHHIGLEANAARKVLGLARKSVVLRGLHDPGEAASLSIIAVDIFFGNEAAEEVVRFPRLGKQRPCRSSTITARQRAQRRLQRTAEHAAVARAGANAGCIGLEYDDGATGAGKRQRGRQAGVARADHRDIGARRQRWRLGNGRRRVLPPVRAFPSLICS